MGLRPDAIGAWHHPTQRFQVIAAHPKPVADFRAGHAASLNFLKGQGMKLSQGKANPTLLGEILERKLR